MKIVSDMEVGSRYRAAEVVHLDDDDHDDDNSDDNSDEDDDSHAAQTRRASSAWHRKLGGHTALSNLIDICQDFNKTSRDTVKMLCVSSFLCVLRFLCDASVRSWT
jgi:hypothetical protein